MSVTWSNSWPRWSTDWGDAQKNLAGYARKIFELAESVFSDVKDLILNPDSFLTLLDIKGNWVNVLLVLKEKIPWYLKEWILSEKDLKKALSSYIRAKWLELVKLSHSKYSENWKLCSDWLFRDRNWNVIWCISEKDSELLAFCLLNGYISDHYMAYVTDIFLDYWSRAAFVRKNKDSNILDEMYASLIAW